MVADAVLIVALFYVERGMKATKELERIRAEKEVQKNISTKESVRAQKAAVREEKKQNMRQQKYNGNMKKASHNIQQPNKNKRN